MGGDPRLAENVEEILQVLDEVDGLIRQKCTQLEGSLQQIDVYQEQLQTLRQRIIQEEQQMRAAMAPAYLINNREKAAAEQQVRSSHTDLTDVWVSKPSSPYFSQLPLLPFVFQCSECLEFSVRLRRFSRSDAGEGT